MKLFGSDYDGTLFKDVEMGVDPVDKAAISKFRKHGNLFGIVSGRAVKVLVNEALKNDIEYDFMIGNNGGEVITKEGAYLLSSKLDNEDAKALYQFFVEQNTISFIAHDGDRAFVNTDGNSVWEGVPMELVTFEALLEAGVTAFLTYHGSESRAFEVATALKACDYNVEVHQNGSFVDVSTQGVDKAKGLAVIAKHFGVKNIYAIGDAQNDRPMIKAYTGFAIADGDASLKDMAHHVVESVSDAIKIIMEG